MNKIGQITFCGANYGSVLQCYATQLYLLHKNIECILFKRKEKGIGKLFQSMGFRLDIIYKYIKYPMYKSVFDEMLNNNKYKTEEQGMSAEAYRLINRFIEHNINMQETSYAKLKKISRKDEYVAFFSGSDQIWSSKWFIKNKLFFLKFAPRNKRVAWMPSFGSDKLAEYNIPAYRKYIEEYAFLSVREQSGAEIINMLTHKEAKTLIDPVFLLDESEWRQIAEGEEHGNYVLAFFLDEPSVTAISMMTKMICNLGCKLIAFSYGYKCLNNINGIEFTSGDPRNFLWYIDNAKFVMTDSFHASAFSIIFRTPFYVFERHMTDAQSQSARIIELMKFFDMNDRFVLSNRSICEKDFFMNTDMIKKEIRCGQNNVERYLCEIIKRD